MNPIDNTPSEYIKENSDTLDKVNDSPTARVARNALNNSKEKDDSDTWSTNSCSRGYSPRRYPKNQDLESAVMDKNYRAVEKSTPENLNKPDEYGNTPIYIAAACEDPRMIKLLIKKGVDLTIRDKNGDTVYDRVKKNLNLDAAILDLLKP
jgi:ankyrin repeat protein